MAFWDDLARQFTDAAPRYLHRVLAPEQVDVTYDPAPVSENTAYCRLWLVETCLARGVEWLQNRYPVVYAATRYEYNGAAVTVPYLAGAEYFQKLTQRNLDKVISANFPLTPLFPYKRGLVELQAGLFSMRVSDPLGSFVETIGQLSKLLPVPELSSVVKLVDPLYRSIETLFDVGEGRMELGYQQHFSPAGSGGANELRPGYFVAILTNNDTFSDRGLCVVNDTLHSRPDGPDGAPSPLKGYSYLLFRLEKRTAQDWEALSTITGLVYRAQDAIQRGQQDEARELLAAIKIAIARSPDVVRADRAAMYARIEEDLRDLGLQGQRSGSARRSLYQIMQRPAPALADAELATWAHLEELFATR
jgi:hypothetical protein